MQYGRLGRFKRLERTGMSTIKTVRDGMVLIIFVSYIALAVFDVLEGEIRTGVISGLFAAVTWLVFF